MLSDKLNNRQTNYVLLWTFLKGINTIMTIGFQSVNGKSLQGEVSLFWGTYSVCYENVKWENSCYFCLLWLKWTF